VNWIHTTEECFTAGLLQWSRWTGRQAEKTARCQWIPGDSVWWCHGDKGPTASPRDRREVAESSGSYDGPVSSSVQRRSAWYPSVVWQCGDRAITTD